MYKAKNIYIAQVRVHDQRGLRKFEIFQNITRENCF